MCMYPSTSRSFFREYRPARASARGASHASGESTIPPIQRAQPVDNMDVPDAAEEDAGKRRRTSAAGEAAALPTSTSSDGNADPPSYAAFRKVFKNRDACIHWLLRLSQQIESEWADEPARRRRLELFRRCLEDCQAHAHADCKELGALVPRMLQTLECTERHFLNLMLPIERKWSRGLRDHEFLVNTDDRPEAAPSQLPMHFVLDHLRSAFNVGALFRTADCLGVSGLWLCGYTATPEDAQVQRTTMGSHAHVAWQWRKTTEQALDELKGKGITVVGLETVAGAPLAAEFVFPRTGVAIVLGNERHGLTPEVLARCDAVVQLPCRGVKNSMNVAVSAGMCGYEVARQWTTVVPQSVGAGGVSNAGHDAGGETLRDERG